MPSKATRAAFGEALLDLGAKNDRIVTLDADLSKSTMTTAFAKKYPDRAFNVGIADAIEHQGPLYLRLTRQNLEPVCPADYRFALGKWLKLREGGDVTLIASGGPLANALEAAKQLESDGIHAEVINAASIKPLDEEMLVASARGTGHVVTVEDHSINGGLGGAVCELLAEVAPTPVRRLGVHGFGESGDLK